LSSSAFAALAATMAGSMAKRPKFSCSAERQRDGKSGPNIGIKAPAIGVQKVARTALAQSKCIQ
jgi:hypothetical protein